MFSKPKFNQFALRVSLLAPPGFLLGLVLTGILAGLPGVKSKGRLDPELMAPMVEVSDVFFVSGVEALKKALMTWTHLPSTCNLPPSQFQKMQCDRFWERAYQELELATLPVIFSLLFMLIAWEIITSFYKSCRITLKKASVEALGQVKKSWVPQFNFFSWFFGFRKILVKLDQGQEVAVFLDRFSPAPLPGETVAVYLVKNGRPIFGAKRRIGILHAPHISVRSDSKK